jgi:hypothetical protein
MAFNDGMGEISLRSVSVLASAITGERSEWRLFGDPAAALPDDGSATVCFDQEKATDGRR